MNIRFLRPILSLVVLLGSATFASAQSNLLFTFDESGANITATVTGSFDTSGLSFTGQTDPLDPVIFPAAASSIFSFGTTTAQSVDQFGNANAPSPAGGFPFLSTFPVRFDNFDSLVTPLSEYLEINVQLLDSPNNASVGLAAGQTIFDADALTNNVLVFEESSFAEFGDSSFLSTTPFTVLSDPSGANTIQFVVAVPEPSSAALLVGGFVGMAFRRRRK